MLKTCDGDATKLKVCTTGDTNLIQQCDCVPKCWAVATVAFQKDPKGVSFGCDACAAPGGAVALFKTSAAACTDLDKVMCWFYSENDLCGDCGFFTMTMEEHDWRIEYEDGSIVIWAWVKDVTATASSGPPFYDCTYSDALFDLAFPHTFPDPGPPRAHPDQSACGDATVEYANTHFCGSCG